MASTLPRTPSLNTDFHDDSSNVSSLGRSATAYITWRSLLNPAAIKTKFDGRFRQPVSIYRERGTVETPKTREELVHGLHRKDVECISSE